MAFQDVIRQRFEAVVEQATGRRVIGFMSGNQQHPDMICEVFVLAPSSLFKDTEIGPDPSLGSEKQAGLARRSARSRDSRRTLDSGLNHDYPSAANSSRPGDHVRSRALRVGSGGNGLASSCARVDRVRLVAALLVCFEPTW
jgi:hypothetical protein